MKIKFIVALLGVMMGLSVSAASINGLVYSTSGDIVRGEWTSQFSKASSLAKSKSVPLVAVWVNPGCYYCEQFESAASSSEFKSWMKNRGYVFIIGVGSQGEGADVSIFCNGVSEFPKCRAWNGTSRNEVFTGRSGKMRSKSGGLGRQFMDSVDAIVGYSSGSGSGSGGGSGGGTTVKSYTVTFNANGGTVSEKSRSVKSGKTVGTLPTATRGKFRFDGWFTASSGGTKVTSSTVIAKSVTFYAHWTRIYPLEVDIMPNSGDGRVSGTGSYASGTEVKLTATPTSGRAFAGWYSGKTLITQEKTCVIVMPSGSALVTAKFLKKADDTVTIGAFKTAAEYETKKEIAPIALSATGGSLPTLSVSKLPSGLKFTSKAIAGHAANTIYGTPTKSGIYSAQVSAKTAGGAKASAILPLVVRAKNERIVRVDCKTDMGKVSGGGIFADGKKASVKATPLSKRCFAGWKLDGKLVSRSQSHSHLVDGRDVTLVADFVSKEQDLASVSLTFGGVGQSTEQIPTNVVRCGVFTSWPVAAKALTGTSVTASGLPSGLKLVKTLVDKELKEYSYEIAGVPTSVSKVNSKTKAVKPTVATVKVTSLGKSSVSYRIAFIVEALPAWAYGTFNGFAAADENGKGVGIAKMTVSASGKISGKFGFGGSNWTYSVSGYSCVESVKSQLSLFRFEGEAKYSSKVRRPFVAEVTQGPCNCSFGDIEGEGFAVQMRRSIWSDKPMPPSAALPKTDLVSFGSVEGVKVSVSKSGKATFAGRLADGTKVSSSSVVFVGKDGHYCAPLIVPATKKYGGFLNIIDFSNDGND